MYELIQVSNNSYYIQSPAMLSTLLIVYQAEKR